MVHSFISALSLLKLVPRQECMLSTYFIEAVWQFCADSFKEAGLKNPGGFMVGYLPDVSPSVEMSTYDVVTRSRDTPFL
jgi:hypothetical protein